MDKKNFSEYFHQNIPAPNTSKAFHRILFEFMKHYGPFKSILLVGEPDGCIEVFKQHFGEEVIVDTLSTSGKKGEYYEYDLNIPTDLTKRYDVVFSQAVLEHVCRPSVFIENLATLATKYVVVMSVGPAFGYHQFPIDCVRFFKDFYVALQKYLPIKLVEYEQDNIQCQFVMYKKTE